MIVREGDQKWGKLDMKLLTFVDEITEKYHLGVLTEKGVLDISGDFETLQEVMANKEKAEALIEFYLEAEHIELKSIDEIKLGPVVPNPEKIICVGVNYKRHAEEMKIDIPELPIIFSKFNNTLAAHNSTVKIPEDTSMIDYEGELAIIIGKKGRNIARDDAMDYVFGYANANDVSDRSAQFATSQWLAGKSYDGFCPIGPYIATLGEIGEPHKLRIKTYVNDELRQDSNTNDMIFKSRGLVSHISKYMTLKPGDIILTGTPEGVASGYKTADKPWIKEGDTVTVEIESLGRLTNRFEKE